MMGRSVAVMALALALALPAAGQEVMYGSTGSGSPRGAFGTVSQTDGTFSLLGDPTSGARENLVGISFDSTGRLFGVVVVSDSGDASTLIEINPNDGLLISTIGPIRDASGGDVKIVDLATQPGTDTLFGIDNDDDTDGAQLWTIDKTTAVATQIGSTGVNRGGIAFGPDGTLYLASTSSELARLDPATGKPIGNVGTIDGCMDGLAVRPSDGALFGTECDGRDIYRINVSSGALTKIGSPDDDTADLAFKLGPQSAPAPALSLLAMAMLAAGLAATGVARLAGQRR